MQQIGIYKITSPTGKIYIGQSINILKRFSEYKRLRCQLQIKIYNSLVKHGVNNHIFEVIKECNIDELNEWERYYQDYYLSLGNELLNLKLTTTKTKSGKLSEYTKRKIGDSNRANFTPEKRLECSIRHKGKIISEEVRKKISDKVKLIYYEKKYKKILQFTLNDEFIREWDSIKEAAEYYHICANGISNCLAGISKMCNKYKWYYK